ncbi:MAG TPA: regulatory iron-sulfur-containing complex subunit RicT [Bacteroidales bacterium]|nr:regulatory iron-sulfur-containing complex subunit RicT [Bacteroidales bacterium]
MTERKFERGCIPIDADENTGNIDINLCCNKLDVFDWLKDIHDPLSQNKYIEVRFKNTRKGIYENVSDLCLEVGDIVAVESSPGHDIGIVSAVGKIALLQMQKYKTEKDGELKKIYRKARTTDIQKWREAISLEVSYMLRTREIARALNLTMKIGDVEFQGDKTKAIFYYIAEERVDFRELIKKMAEEFKIRIEMKQIGARQEAGRIGGIGPCGRELCCTIWMTEFNSVSTNSARLQELSLNPQKLAGQCSKLKCCLNYELPLYLEARQNFPEDVTVIITKQGEATHIKNDVFRSLMYYEIKINDCPVIRGLSTEKVKEIIELNKKGIYPDNIFENEKTGGRANISFKEELNSDSLTRFDSENVLKKKRKKKKKNRHNKNNQDENQ